MNASECRCHRCSKPAVAFWPRVDPDIRSFPYCAECLKKIELELYVKLAEDAERRGRGETT